ncbi:hypothetical protein DSM3645_02863 [Blastopirellula marina DSM 3645]|uniref:Uncharacterized protein n=1 Tax=Blastopirellula marina DSM 3645 TaxID=314230 RepID=A3ZVN6_9BACT|nr:hypothetical protein DSM3645_02863 [Blastopirellula marina DSM 3645]
MRSLTSWITFVRSLRNFIEIDTVKS